MSWYAAKMGNDHQGLIIDDADGRNVAVAYDKADAPILAAAPCLYKALKECSALLEDWWECAGAPPHATEIALIEARAALAKARGE